MALVESEKIVYGCIRHIKVINPRDRQDYSQVEEQIGRVWDRGKSGKTAIAPTLISLFESSV